MSIKIYLNAEKTTTQIINTHPLFEGNVAGLIDNITGGKNFGYEIVK